MTTCSPSARFLPASLFALLVVLIANPRPVSAEIVNFDFSTNPPLASSKQPDAWFPDRRAPAEFDSVQFFDEVVLQIGISAADFDSNAFYNTQGRKYDITVASGGSIEAQLYIPSEWKTSARRSDLWATGSSTDPNNATAYMIFGFTSLTGTPRLRVFDSDVGWIDLDYSIDYDNWVTLRMDFTGTAFVYSVNDTEVFTDANINGTTQFHDVMLQAYNSGVSYNAHWKTLVVDTALVPEPSTAACLLAAGGIAALRRRHRVNDIRPA